jgi:hypothetical protein
VRSQQRQRRADEPAVGVAGDAVVRVVLEPAQHVPAIGQAGRADAVGDADAALVAEDAVRPAHDVAADVDVVAHELHGHVLRLVDGDERTRRAVVERRHGVVEVRGVADAGVDGGARLLVRRVGVADGRDDAGATRRRTASRPPSSSGAMVIMRSAPAVASRTSSNALRRDGPHAFRRQPADAHGVHERPLEVQPQQVRAAELAAAVRAACP